MKSVLSFFFLFVFLFPEYPAQVFTFKTDTVAGAPGSAVYVRLRARQFTNITAMQGCVSWDTSVAKLDTISSYLLPQLNASNFNLNNRQNGWYNFVWSDAFGVGVNYAQDSAMWIMKFTINSYAPPCSFTKVRVINGNGAIGQTPLEVADNSFVPIPYDTLQGRINVNCSSGITTGSISGTSFCASSTLNVPFTLTGTFNNGNVFTAQLSNSVGSFAAPVTIGTLNGTASGSIACTIPPGTAPGFGYRIRVNGSNPSVTGTDNGTNIRIDSSSVGGTLSSINDSLCAGDSMLISLSGYRGGGFAWYTSSNGTSFSPLSGSGSSLMVHPAQTPAYYRADVTYSACPSSPSDTLILTVVAPPLASFTHSLTPPFSVQFSSTSTGASFYDWNFGDTQTSSQASPSHTYSGPGNYTVILTVRNSLGCSDADTQTVNVTDPNGIALHAAHNLVIFPNPASGTFYLQLPEGFQGGYAEFYDMNGRLAGSRHVPAGTSQLAMIESGGLAPGLMHIRLKDRDHEWTGNLLIR